MNAASDVELLLRVTLADGLTFTPGAEGRLQVLFSPSEEASGGSSDVVVGVGAISGGILAGLLSAATFERVLRADQTLTDEARAAAAAVFGGLAAAAAVSTLGFLGALLLNAVDACYVCFALDLEALRNCQPQVSAVLHQIAKPTTSFVVQNPGECMPTVLGEAVQH